MASSSEVTAAARRIVDYLNDGEELGAEGAAVQTPPCTPAAAAAPAMAVAVGEPARALALPRFRWPRLVRHGLRRMGGGGDKGKQKQEEVVVEKSHDSIPVAAAVSTSGCEPSPSAASDKRHPDLGVGLSLVFLLAKTSDEFNKMVKVRTEMEALLKDIRDEVRIKSGGGTGTEAHDDEPKDRNRESTTSSCVTTDGNEAQSARARMEMEYQAAASSSGVQLAGYEKSSSAEDGGGCCPRMDALEEEFHAEMDLLQVNYGSETPSFLPDPEEEEDEEHYSEPYDEMADYRNEADDDSGGVVEDDHDRDDDDDDDGDAEYYNGVSAVQLERRLHELLHERNRDRIEELEAALRCAEQKLVEKEMEVSLWKDTAKLALRQDKELQ